MVRKGLRIAYWVVVVPLYAILAFEVIFSRDQTTFGAIALFGLILAIAYGDHWLFRRRT